MKRVAPSLVTLLVTAGAFWSSGCKPSVGRPAAAPGGHAPTCERLGAHVVRFGEAIGDAGVVAKGRLASYAGLLELLVSFERASTDLKTELAALPIDDAGLSDAVRRGIAALDRARAFARAEREGVERHAREVGPLARETQEAWIALRAACDGKKAPRDCVALRSVVSRYDAAATSAEHAKVIDELAAMRTSPAIARTRDRAVKASRSVHGAIEARTQAASSMPDKWSVVQKDVEVAMDALAERCRGTAVALSPRFVSTDQPDPRKLTVLVKVRPPAKLEKTFGDLAKAAKDDDERSFYEARARGAFGSGFVVVRSRAAGDGNEVLVVTNRHVVDLGDRAALELADGSSLGSADIAYADPLRDVAILKPTSKLGIDRGFPFAGAPAKDQQVVIATGFPGLVGKPSYQTTRGYVSNESFRLDEGSLPMTYVQHTAPIDPGSSGGPLTDEKGHVLGVNTLKVTNREAVGLAVPSSAIMETMRRADAVEARRASAEHRRDGARLACLGLMAELATPEPRLEVLEPMISNELTASVGIEAAAALEGDETFDRVWEADSLRAMRIATLVRLRAATLAGGGASVLETCEDADRGDLAAILTEDRVRFRVRLANFETRQIALRFEQGQYKLAHFDITEKPEGKSPKTPGKTPPKRRRAPPAPRGARK